MKGSSPLPWSVRYQVAIGIAEAVAYLHNGTERCVVHRDIKPSNILLSSKKIPKVRFPFADKLCSRNCSIKNTLQVILINSFC